MDPDKKSSSHRKHRFAPKAPSRRKRAVTVPKKEKADDSDDFEAKQQLLQRLNELGNRRQRPEVEDNVQATFFHGGKRSITARGSNVPQDGSLKQSSESDSMDLDDHTKKSVSPLSVGGPSAIIQCPTDDSENEEYIEPWNYANTYYPTTLPWRRPYSGNPDILDEAEFGEASTKMDDHKNTTTPASELGFLNHDETSEDVKLLFLQFPPSLPAMKRFATAKGKELAGSPGPLDHKVPMEMNTGTPLLDPKVPVAMNMKTPLDHKLVPKAMNMVTKGTSTAGPSQRICSLEDLSEGQMGKLLVYKSGAVQLKLGETLYDVSPGSDCSFAQDVVAFNIQKKECCCIGNLDKRAVVTPDVEYLLNSVINLG